MAMAQLENAQAPEDPATSGDDEQPIGESPVAKWKGRIERSKNRRKDLLRNWQMNVDYRRGKMFETESDYDRIAVAKDWSLTKSKQAQLFSQVPKVIPTARQKAYAPAAFIWGKRVNDRLEAAKVGVAMDEVLPDVINAAGIGAVIVSYESLQAPKEMPEQDPSALPPQMQLALAQGTYKIPMTTVNAVVDERFTVKRVSPADLLWPKEFMGSDFDDAPWIGRSGRTTWAEAKASYGLTDDQKSAVVGDDRTDVDKLNYTHDREKEDSDVVSFDEIFYWRYRYLPNEKYYKAIQHLVFIKGIDKPVIDEPWKGQRFDENLQGYLGSCKFPIRILTLTYISDECIPPSDSEMIRPQVDELIKSRGQIMKQRDHSIPVRWYDVNRIDATIQTQLMQGTYQGFIPTNGEGTRAIGEVARSSYPKENFAFDGVIQHDLEETTGIGPNQGGTPMASGEHSATEAGITEQNFQTRIGYERGKCVVFFLGIADVMAGLIALYDDFEMPEMAEEDKQRLMLWDRTRINHAFAFSVRADSTVLLSSEQRIQRLMNVINNFGKSGAINPNPLIEEVLNLTGIDPATVMVQPKEKEPEQPSISFSFKGVDLSNAMVLAILEKGGMAPSPDELKAAKKMLLDMHTPPPAEPLPSPPGMPGPGGPAGGPGAPTGAAPPGNPADVMQDHRPDWQMADRIDKRRES